MENVTKRLLADKVDGSELESVLLGHFQSSSGGVSKLATYYPDEQSATLIVHYSKNDRIRLIETSLSYQEVTGLAGTIQDTLLDGVKSVWIDKVFFTEKPIRGVWQCQLFAIREAILKVPSGGRELIGYPAIIKYQVNRTGNWHIDRLREERIFKEYIQVLGVFVPRVINTDFENQLGFIQGVKVFSSQKDEEAFYNRRIIKDDNGYGIDNFDGSQSERLETPDTRAIPYLDDELIFGGEDSELEELYIPKSLDEWFVKYGNISIRNKTLFLRAAYWISFARKVYPQSKSASLVACVQSVESLIPRNEDLEKQFKIFLESHVEGDDEVKELLYDRRSSITHGSSLLLMDEEDRMITRPSIHNDFKLVWKASAICRKAIIGWFNDVSKR